MPKQRGKLRVEALIKTVNIKQGVKRNITVWHSLYLGRKYSISNEKKHHIQFEFDAFFEIQTIMTVDGTYELIVMQLIVHYCKLKYSYIIDTIKIS